MEIVIQNPWIFVFLLFIPVLVVLHYYFFENNKRRAMKFSNFAAMKRVTGTTLITKNTSQLVVRIIIYTLIVVSATNPIIWYEGDVNVNDYVIAIDSSASMLAEDVLPDRLTVAKQAALTFVNELKTETEVGLISFSGVSFIKSPLTDNRVDIRTAINKVEIELSGGTDIGAAIITATNLLANSDKTKNIILITDGSNTAGSFIEESYVTGLDYAVNQHVKIYTVGIGTGLSSPGYVENEQLQAVIDKDSLMKIAKSSGGRYFEVKNSAEMILALRQIETETQKADISLEFGPWLLVISVLGLLFEWGLLNTKFRALP